MSRFGPPWISRHRRGLRPLVYHLLSQGPRSGAELMDDIERLSRGFWRPSPGSIYPLLEEMTHDGVIRKGSDGRYALTDPTVERHWGPGRFGPRSVDEAASELRGLVAYLEDLKTSHADEFAKAAASMREARDRLSQIVG